MSRSDAVLAPDRVATMRVAVPEAVRVLAPEISVVSVPMVTCSRSAVLAPESVTARVLMAEDPGSTTACEAPDMSMPLKAGAWTSAEKVVPTYMYPCFKPIRTESSPFFVTVRYGTRLSSLVTVRVVAESGTMRTLQFCIAMTREKLPTS